MSDKLERLASESPLPPEIWLRIAVEADPLDVLCLSQACRTLHQLLSNRHVWLSILRTVMHRAGPFISSYSTDDLSIDELRRVAAGPQRWQRLTGTNCVPCTELDAHPSILPVRITDHTSSLPMDCPIFRLVPGGRFLVTGRSHHNFDRQSLVRVDLWDLGPPFIAGPTRPSLVASLNLSEGLFPDSLLQVKSDLWIACEGELRISVSASDPYGPQPAVHVLSVSLSRQGASITLLNTMRFDASVVTSLALFGDRVLIFLDKVNVVIWNYQTSQIGACRNPYDAPSLYQLPSHQPDHDILLTEDYVLLVQKTGSSTGVSVWDASRLEMVPSNSMLGLSACPPDLSLPAPWFGEFTRLLSSLGGRRNLVLLDFFGDGQGTLSCRRFCVSLEANHSASVCGIIQELGYGHFPFSRQTPTSLGETSTGICTAVPAPGYVEDYWMHTYKLTPLVSNSGEMPPAMGVSLGLGMGPIAVCPYSGRIIFKRYDDGPRRLYCSEYLCPPNVTSPPDVQSSMV